MNKGNKRLAQTIVVSGISVSIGYIINFLITPYITDNIGIDAYGFVSIARTSVNYATIITTALTAFIVRYISISYHENKINESNQYFSSSIAACVVMSGAIFIIAALITWKLEYFLNIPENLIPSIKTLFIVVYINFIVTTVTTPYSAAAYIKNRLDLTGYVKVVGHIFDALVLLCLFVCFKPKVWFVGIGTLTTAIVLFLCSKMMTIKLTPELKFTKNNITLDKVKGMMRNGVWNSLNSLGNVLNSGLDLLISNLMLSGTQTGQIAVAKTIESMFTMLYQIVFQPFQPRLLKAYAEHDRNIFVKELQKSMKVCGFFSNLALAGFFALGNLYFKLWLPSQNYNYLYVLTLITILGALTSGVIQPVYYINTLTLKMKIPCILTIVGGILNVVAMYVLLKFTDMGPFAVVITTDVIMMGMNFIFNPLYSAKCIGATSKVFYTVMGRHILSAIVMSVSFWCLTKVIKPDGWFELIISALIMCVTGGIIHIVVMCSKHELKDLINKVQKQIYRYVQD